MRTIHLTKNENNYHLIVPEAIAKLYSFEDGQVFNLEVRESENMDKFLFLTYTTKVK